MLDTDYISSNNIRIFKSHLEGKSVEEIIKKYPDWGRRLLSKSKVYRIIRKIKNVIDFDGIYVETYFSNVCELVFYKHNGQVEILRLDLDILRELRYNFEKWEMDKKKVIKEELNGEMRYLRQTNKSLKKECNKLCDENYILRGELKIGERYEH